MSKTYSGSIELTKLKSAVVELNGKSGKVRGVFIPIEDNYATEKDGRVYLDVNVRVGDVPDKYGQEGFIAHRAGSAIYKAADDVAKEALKKLPILGNFKSFAPKDAPNSIELGDVSGDSFNDLFN